MVWETINQSVTKGSSWDASASKKERYVYKRKIFQNRKIYEKRKMFKNEIYVSKNKLFLKCLKKEKDMLEKERHLK